MKRTDEEDVEIRKVLSDNIKHYVENSHHTEKKISENIGVTPRMLYRYKYNLAKPSAITFIKLCKFLRVSPTRMFMTKEEWSIFNE